MSVNKQLFDIVSQYFKIIKYSRNKNPFVIIETYAKLLKKLIALSLFIYLFIFGAAQE